jgi:hypothetical protein
MDVDELLARAWAAVESSGVPESLQAMAFQEAISYLRAATVTEVPKSGSKKPPAPSLSAAKPDAPDGAVSADDFFERLAHESGAPETDLRDILQLKPDSKVHVSPPTKSLGSSIAEQARTTIALVAAARGIGLSESPVDAQAVRDEVDRKHCYQKNNFAAKHLGPLKGFNSGANRNEIVLASKWVDEFKAAIHQAHGRAGQE